MVGKKTFIFQPFVPDHFANLQRIIIVRILHLANEPYKCDLYKANIAYFVILFVLSAIEQQQKFQALFHWTKALQFICSKERLIVFTEL